MKRKLLLPHKYKAIGWIIFIPAVVLGIVSSFYDFHDLGIKVNVFAIQYDEIFGDQKIFTVVKTDITNTILGVLLIVGGLFVAFSREREEDEFIASLRLNSLLWAVLLNLGGSPLSIDPAVFDHQRYFANVAYILSGIAINSNDVCKRIFADKTNFIIHTENGSVDRCGGA